MAKQTNRLPSVERSYPVEKPSKLPEPPGEAVTVPVTVETVEIQLPIGPRSNGYLNNRVQVLLTTQAQAIAMQRFTNGLIETRAVLKDGTKVNCEQHAIRWLMETLPIV